MASTFAGVMSVGSLASSTNRRVKDNNLSSFASISSTSSLASRHTVSLTRPPRTAQIKAAAKDLYFNKDGSAIKKLQVSPPLYTPLLLLVSNEEIDSLSIIILKDSFKCDSFLLPDWCK